MTHLRCGLLGAALLLGGAAHAQSAASAPATKPDKVKLSYAIGYQIGSQFADGKPDVEIPVLLRAIQDAYARRHPSVSMQDMHQQLQRLDQQMHADALAEFKRVAAANARKSAQYLAQNRQRPGVVQLPSGIQYAVLSAGSGKASPTVTSTVTVNYRGMLVDGTEFDSTWAHGAPVSFTVDKVIRGWQDVIPRMHVGDRWKVVIPPQLAYGETGALPRIGPNEALVFEIELLAIKPDTGKP
ncbi:MULTISPECIES: FKBP-type peptidyl-prolyl cis-trans isomerase [Rhodanobacter]|uniref:Peptidyl-prolyl cis-trans isomerase n=1 Tax=Rhodanobacter denitrificans TaxID=666685 RepID=M4NHT9_9GAMM|nr:MULTISPECIES: FKBP-type peptidyl-prolyl cis-trans isomerase [Rhodanobacter]AGG89667.1 FKBP-type peptidyl-prolyl cis-trans isomerase [Rhodanobacter denitrificans]KZC19196.1 peptidylprolyl isomerase [Rhodanobacter denitrificans]UJJ49867.1 FKBP-type peptidyl-prolyl cis-trans isomerase [Rhodanobacter denitrificans]UJJ57941.1 FKBP-type peptidyl-prolyl cis-trans isomerase [Rhodanobacter denitrificans]UJM85065.1 FKBP-type peptidyl-prolyl cis-trans isomerase [Rhodanobacter denitrificans]